MSISKILSEEDNSISTPASLIKRHVVPKYRIPPNHWSGSKKEEKKKNGKMTEFSF